MPPGGRLAKRWMNWRYGNAPGYYGWVVFVGHAVVRIYNSFWRFPDGERDWVGVDYIARAVANAAAGARSSGSSSFILPGGWILDIESVYGWQIAAIPWELLYDMIFDAVIAAETINEQDNGIAFTIAATNAQTLYAIALWPATAARGDNYWFQGIL